MVDVLLDLTPLDTSSRMRGIGRYAHELGSAMAALPRAARGGLEIAGLIALSGAAVGPLDWPGTPGEIRRREWRYRFARRLELVATLRRLRPRLLHATESLGTPRGSWVPRVTTCHDLIRLTMRREYIGGPIRGAANRALETLRYHVSRRVIAVSQQTADDLMRLCALPAARVDVVPHGLNHQRFRPPTDGEKTAAVGLRAELGLRAPYLLYLGGGDPRKSLDVLTRAFAALGSRDVELCVAGHFSAIESEAFSTALKAAGHPANLRRIGFVPEEAITALYWGAEALVFPSVYEGFGFPVLEAMACGCPVVAVRATSVAEVMGDAGLDVPARDAPALTHAMRRVLAEPSLRGDLARAGLARAARFTWERAAEQTIASYQQALRGT